jgi:hypothetical protein
MILIGVDEHGRELGSTAEMIPSAIVFNRFLSAGDGRARLLRAAAACAGPLSSNSA